MNKVLHELLAGLHPVLMEVGATDRPTEIWDDIAPWSVYFGIGSDIQTENAALSHYRQHFLFNEIVVPPANAGPTTFYETQDPIYSSVLPPDPVVIAEYSDLADVRIVKTSTTSTTSIANLLDRASVERIDWMKTNINGMDARLFESLPAKVRDCVLAVDTVLDLIPLHLDQDNTLCFHQDLLRQGFWLSRLANCGAVRMRGKSVTELQRRGIGDPVRLTAKYVRDSPAWAFGRYFRTVDAMNQSTFDRRDYLVLWSFALIDGQLGFCTDLALGYEERFGKDTQSERTLQTIAVRLEEYSRRKATPYQRIRKLIPDRLRKTLKPWIFGW